ncbi:MAG TPA: segregation/condensation protein A [Chthoniobacterales bacterium]
MQGDHKVQLEVFEGPLDLLLYLVKKEEVDIYAVSIERITRQYLEYLDTFRLLDLQLAGEFLVMAANLIYLKSRSLLPVHQQPPDEETEEEDPRWNLIRQLVEYKKFKDAAAALHHREQEQENILPRVPEKPDLGAPDVLLKQEVSIFDLINAFQKVLRRLEGKRENLREIFEENFTVSDKIEAILILVHDTRTLRFSDLFASVASRTEIVVTFLALLELIRLKQLRVTQRGTFDEIVITRAAVEEGDGVTGKCHE